MNPDAVRAMLIHGRGLARLAGVVDPSPEAAVWELMREAADTLRRLPDREWGWLASCSRAAWPEVMQEQADRFAAAVAQGGWEKVRVRMGPPTRDAIGRMDTLFRLMRAVPRPVDCRRAFLLAEGVPAHAIAKATHCSRRTVFNARDRVVDLIAQVMGQELLQNAA